MSVCSKCNKRLIYVAKWQLCKPCYNQAQRSEFKDIKFKPENDRHMREFISNYFTDHSNYLFREITFPLGKNFRDKDITFTPDFYDIKRDTYIEVVTAMKVSRNKHIYATFQSLYPVLKAKFEIRKPNGKLYQLMDPKQGAKDAQKMFDATFGEGEFNI